MLLQYSYINSHALPIAVYYTAILIIEVEAILTNPITT